MAGSAGQTITASVAEERTRGGDGGAPALFLVVECSRPRAGAVRYGLGGIDGVVLGRGGRRSASRDGRTLRVEVPDEKMSGEHARLDRSFARWVVSDAGSKNGTFVNGERVRGGRREEDPEDPRGNTVVNPVLLVEVLSLSTEEYDRGEKLAHDKRIAR